MENIFNKIISDYFSNQEKTVQNTAEANFQKGWSEGMSGNYSASIDYFTKSIAIDCDYKLAYVFRGAAYINLGEKDKASLDFDKAIELGDGDAQKLKDNHC